MDTKILWTEDYRPKTIAECILPEGLKKQFQSYVAMKMLPNLLLVGNPGMGKTTVARALADELGWDTLFIKASEDRGIDTIRTKVRHFATSMSLSGARKLVIFDEADNLSFDCQQALRGFMEEFSDNCSFIFTGNNQNKLTDAIQSRDATIVFKIPQAEAQLMAAAFFKRIIAILKEKKVEYDKNVVVQIVHKYFPDFRKTLNELQSFAASGMIDVGALAISEDSSIKEVIGHVKTKDFGAIRRWVGLNTDNSARVFRSLYDELAKSGDQSAIPDAIVVLGKYQYQHGFVADPEINIAACLVELMNLRAFG